MLNYIIPELNSYGSIICRYIFKVNLCKINKVQEMKDVKWILIQQCVFMMSMFYVSPEHNKYTQSDGTNKETFKNDRNENALIETTRNHQIKTFGRQWNN